MSGAPTTTPSAYALMMCPAVGTETPRSAATFGSNPIMTNSPVPMPKPPIPSASSAHPGRPAPPATALSVEYVKRSCSLNVRSLCAVHLLSIAGTAASVTNAILWIHESFIPAGRGMNRYHQWHGCRTYAENPRHRSLQRRSHCGHALGSARGGERTLIAVPLGPGGVGLLCAAGFCGHRARLGDPRGGWLVRLDLKSIRTPPGVSRRLALLGLEYPLLSHADSFDCRIRPLRLRHAFCAPRAERRLRGRRIARVAWHRASLEHH